MTKGKGMGRYTYSAALVGLALMLLVGLAQCVGLLAQALLSLAGADTATGDARKAVEWLAGALSLLAVLGTFVLPLVFMLKSGKRVGLRLMLGKSRVPVTVLLPLFLGVVLALNALANGLRSLFNLLANLPPAESAALPATGFGRVLYFLSTCVAAAVLEELVFRGGIQALLRGWGARFSVVFTSLLFTLMHADVWELPTVFALSLLLGAAAEVSGSVVPCILLHFANNAFVFGIQVAGEQFDLSAAMALVFFLILAFLLMFGGAVWTVHARKLGPKLRLGRDQSQLGGVGRRLGRLFGSPVFDVGFTILLAHFILRLLSA